MPSDPSPGVSPSSFRQLLGRFATGITVVTARTPGGGHAGMTASSLSSVSLVPPLVSVCIDRVAELHDVLAQAPRFALSILAADQEEISRRFATRGAHALESVGRRRTPSGLPVLDPALAWLECESWAHYDGGDHSIFVGRVVDGHAGEGAPLLYFRGGYATLGRG